MNSLAIDYATARSVENGTSTGESRRVIPLPESEAWARAAAAHTGFGASECVTLAPPVPARDDDYASLSTVQ
jgi:hypothetical protein